jgi:biotin carboxyl carrier protein
VTGLEAIEAANGWVMSVTGATIVFCGLAVLSLIISQLHRLLALVEKSPEGKKKAEEEPKPLEPPPSRPKEIIKFCPDDIGETARLYQPLVGELGDSFELVALHRLARERDYPHTHMSISCLRSAGHLVPEGEGRFSWRAEVPETESEEEAETAQPAPPPPAAAPARPVEPAAAPTVDAGKAAPPAEPAPQPAPRQPEPTAAAGETPVTAPMPGMIIRYEKKEGEPVAEGETVVVLEAMKMENALPSPASGTVKSVRFESGDAVAKGEVLCLIG